MGRALVVRGEAAEGGAAEAALLVPLQPSRELGARDGRCLFHWALDGRDGGREADESRTKEGGGGEQTKDGLGGCRVRGGVSGVRGERCAKVRGVQR